MFDSWKTFKQKCFQDFKKKTKKPQRGQISSWTAAVTWFTDHSVCGRTDLAVSEGFSSSECVFDQSPEQHENSSSGLLRALDCTNRKQLLVQCVFKWKKKNHTAAAAALTFINMKTKYL